MPVALGSTRRRKRSSSGRTEYNTPRVVLVRLARLGRIACDPCWNRRSKVKARVRYTEREDGLKQPWPSRGLTFINPPYGGQLKRWVEAIYHAATRREIVLLVPASTETRWFCRMLVRCQACVCWRGRLTFDGMTSPAFFGSALFYFGNRPHAFVEAFRGAAYAIKCEACE